MFVVGLHVLITRVQVFELARERARPWGDQYIEATPLFQNASGFETEVQQGRGLPIKSTK